MQWQSGSRGLRVIIDLRHSSFEILKSEYTRSFIRVIKMIPAAYQMGRGWMKRNRTLRNLRRSIAAARIQRAWRNRSRARFSPARFSPASLSQGSFQRGSFPRLPPSTGSSSSWQSRTYGSSGYRLNFQPQSPSLLTNPTIPSSISFASAESDHGYFTKKPTEFDWYYCIPAPNYPQKPI